MPITRGFVVAIALWATTASFLRAGSPAQDGAITFEHDVAPIIYSTAHPATSLVEAPSALRTTKRFDPVRERSYDKVRCLPGDWEDPTSSSRRSRTSSQRQARSNVGLS